MYENFVIVNKDLFIVAVIQLAAEWDARQSLHRALKVAQRQQQQQQLRNPYLVSDPPTGTNYQTGYLSRPPYYPGEFGESTMMASWDIGIYISGDPNERRGGCLEMYVRSKLVEEKAICQLTNW